MSNNELSAEDNEFAKYIEQTRNQKVIDPEFDNFIQKVDEINLIVKGLASKDSKEIDKASRQAELYLHSKEDVSEEGCQVKLNKSSINLSAFREGPKKNDQKDSMNPDEFMKYVEKDSNERAQDKKERKAVSDAFKKRANDAFRNKEYNRALLLYNRAVDEIRDSCVLYTNRALCNLKLRLYKRAISDCDWALKLNEYSLKALLYKGKALHCLGEEEEALEVIEVAKVGNPKNVKFIDDFVELWDKTDTDDEDRK